MILRVKKWSNKLDISVGAQIHTVVKSIETIDTDGSKRSTRMDRTNTRSNKKLEKQIAWKELFNKIIFSVKISHQFQISLTVSANVMYSK
jgi:hypothetical protein